MCYQGHEEYKSLDGDVLALRPSIPLKKNIQAGMKIIAFGSGRRELVINCASLGAKTWGLDYASKALTLAQEVKYDKKKTLKNKNHYL